VPKVPVGFRGNCSGRPLVATKPPAILRLLSRAIRLVGRDHLYSLFVQLRKLSAYPRQNGLALALKELGKLERTLFTLQWLQDPELRRRSHVGLNKGEQQNALRRAVFFNRLGEIRDRSYEGSA